MTRTVLRQRVLSFLAEDVGPGDITSRAIVPEALEGFADILVKETAVVAGLAETQALFEAVGCTARALVPDGTWVKARTAVMRVEGPVRRILEAERCALNLLMRMSGIATLTRRVVETVGRVAPSIRVAATRKTAPGLLYFDKRAVQVGGGHPHRYGLYEAVLIKDNHIRVAGSMREAIRRIRAQQGSREQIEAEATSLKDALQAVEAGAQIVLLDNMSPQRLGKVVQELTRRGMRERVFLEASGGITSENAVRYARTGVDMLSLGELTHSPRAVDASLELRKPRRTLSRRG